MRDDLSFAGESHLHALLLSPFILILEDRRREKMETENREREGEKETEKEMGGINKAGGWKWASTRDGWM